MKSTLVLKESQSHRMLARKTRVPAVLVRCVPMDNVNKWHCARSSSRRRLGILVILSFFLFVAVDQSVAASPLPPGLAEAGVKTLKWIKDGKPITLIKELKGLIMPEPKKKIEPPVAITINENHDAHNKIDNFDAMVTGAGAWTDSMQNFTMTADRWHGTMGFTLDDKGTWGDFDQIFGSGSIQYSVTEPLVIGGRNMTAL